jgi:hypothetical protein
LPASCDQGHQFLALRVWQWPGLRLDQFGEMRQDPGIDRIGFRQSASGASKVSYLARIDNSYRQTRCGQFTSGSDFVATAGFKHGAAYAQLLQTLDQGGYAALIVDYAEAFIAGAQRHIEPCFRHIDSDKHLIFHCFLPPNAPPILARYGLINPGDCSGPAFLSGRDDQALPTVLKTWSRDGLSRPESLKSLER